MSRPTTVESTPFELAPGVSEGELLAASERLEREVLAKTEGYLGRLLLRQDARKWTDLVFWRSLEDAAKVIDVVETSTAFRDYFACMAMAERDDPEADVIHFRVAGAYGGVCRLEEPALVG